MQIVIIEKPIKISELKELAKDRFGELIKAVVDIEKNIIAIGGDLHSDEEAHLLANGSQQSKLWGINLYPYKPTEEFVEFDSMINLRPSYGNRSRSVDDPEIRKKITEIVDLLVEKYD